MLDGKSKNAIKHINLDKTKEFQDKRS